MENRARCIIMKLTKSQLSCKAELLETINDPLQKYRTLSGGAGFGKTTLVVDILRDIPITKTIGYASPTHKCCKVIKSMLIKNKLDHRCEVNTIHSVIGLKLKQVGTQELLSKDKYSQEKIYDILIVDECSMLNDEILGYIVESNSKVVIFVGDECQVHPIHTDEYGYTIQSDDISKSFTEVSNKSMLTEVVRCALDSPVVALGVKLRACQSDVSLPLPQIKTHIHNDMGIHVYEDGEFYNEIYKMFSSDEFKADVDYCRCIAYTNNKVDEINSKVRKHLYGNDVEEYILGEVIIAQKSKLNMFNNAEEFEIVGVDKGFDSNHSPTPLSIWHLEIKSIDSGDVYNVDVIDRDSIKEFKQLSDTLAKRARVGNARMNWALYWNLQNAFTPFKHIYACTGHKSQGSTFDNTFIHTLDFLQYGVNMGVKRLLYTATTRSRYNTIFLKG